MPPGTGHATPWRMFNRGSLTLLHVRGVPIRAHWTLLLILPYLAAVLSVQFERVAQLAGVEHVRLVLPPLFWGAVLAVALFASVALHELAHTLVAMRFGGKVNAITLMLLGGVSQIASLPRQPRVEGIMAVAGPLTSLALGGLLLALDQLIPNSAADLRMFVFYLASMNLLVGLFNLLPAFPMDGGRVLRALLAGRMAPGRATAIAAAVGKAAALVMGLAGLWTGSFLLILIAVFVYFGAGAEAAGERVRAVLESVRIVDLVAMLGGPPATIDLEAPLSEALPRMRAAGRPALVAVDALGQPAGVLWPTDVAGVPAENRESLRVSDLGRDLSARLVVVRADASAVTALEQAIAAGASSVVVVDPAEPPERRLVGLGMTSEIEAQAALALRLAKPPAGAAIRPLAPRRT